MVDAVTGKLLRAGSGENKVALNTCVDDLDDDLPVGEAYNEAVFGGVADDGIRGRTSLNHVFDVLLVFGLGNQPLAGIVCKVSGHSAGMKIERKTHNQSCPPSGDGT